MNIKDIKFPLILDGATGTQLQKRGFAGDMSAEQWILEHPQAIIDIQSAYVSAGSQVLYAPTFGANSRKLSERGITGKTDEINRELVALSKRASEGKALIAGDISPTGQFMEPLGDATFEDLVSIYSEQAAALEKAGVDLFVIETMMTLSDARAAVLAVRSVSDKPVFVTFTCDENGRSLTGTDMAAALTVLQGMGIDAFGLNCSAGPDKMLPQLRRLRRYAQVPLIAKPNAGMPHMADGKAVYDCPPGEFVKYIPDMLDAGVCIFGGCCGTDEEYIAALVEALRGAECRLPAPEFCDMLPAATEKEAVYLPRGAEHGAPLSSGDDFEDDLDDAMDDDFPVFALNIRDDADIEALTENQYMMRKPLCLVCGDAQLLESALQVYQGRALYEGCLSGDELQPLRDKYGLLI